MADPDEDPGEDDDELDELAGELGDIVYAFAEENDLPPGFISALLLEMAVQSRMVAYVSETGKPSVTGLKLELDRMKRDTDALVGEAKKGAGSFIESAREALEGFEDGE